MTHRERPHDDELSPLDFDEFYPEYGDDVEWWRQQDEDMTREELERIESDAEKEELRHNGYWD